MANGTSSIMALVEGVLASAIGVLIAFSLSIFVPTANVYVPPLLPSASPGVMTEECLREYGETERARLRELGASRTKSDAVAGIVGRGFPLLLAVHILWIGFRRFRGPLSSILFSTPLLLINFSLLESLSPFFLFCTAAIALAAWKLGAAGQSNH